MKAIEWFECWNYHVNILKTQRGFREKTNQEVIEMSAIKRFIKNEEGASVYKVESGNYNFKSALDQVLN